MSGTHVLALPIRAVAASAALFAVLVAVPSGAQAATSASPWAEPNAALGGTSLAVYVAQHHLRALGPLGV